MNQAACRAPIQAQPKATINVYTKDIGAGKGLKLIEKAGLYGVLLKNASDAIVLDKWSEISCTKKRLARNARMNYAQRGRLEQKKELVGENEKSSTQFPLPFSPFLSIFNTLDFTSFDQNNSSKLFTIFSFLSTTQQ